jgi:dolichol-phosphate mannosyltransferase
MPMKKLSIIIPVFNEEKTVAQLLKRVLSVKLPVDQVEYIVVDDGSTDNSEAEVKNLRLKKIKLLVHKKNMGKGAAVRTGLKHATGDYIIIQDADLEYNPVDIKKLLKALEEKGKPVVYGTRLKRLPNMKEDVKTFYLLHYFGNRFLSLITSMLYGYWVTDMECCYKLVPRKALKNIQLHAKGFDFEPEITAKLLKRGYQIAEVSITTTPRGYDGGKKLHAVRDGTKALLTLLKYRFVE